MRLLRIQENGGFSLVEYMDEREIPPFAILSHRWGADHEEVTLKDIVEGTGRDKTGYEKIRACARQTAKDRIELFWVDTCCIDKTSSSELSESINSMWRWYRISRVCYAYLNDVPADASAAARDIGFTQSAWFTRGWTLQELLAPSTVVFYDSDWQRIGTKDELAEKINGITKINIYYLASDESRLRQASIAEKMSWASTRETKRTEDTAYSLLGIFDINMPLLYGEGVKAFQRLQEEIMKQSDDQSIFAWTPVSKDFQSGAILAPSPAHFRDCGEIIRNINKSAIKPYTMTNRGLHAEFQVLGQGDEVIAVLNCRYSHDFFCDLGIQLRKHNEGQYRRTPGPLRKVPIAYWTRGRLQPMYIDMAPGNATSIRDPSKKSCLLRNLPKGYVVSNVYPPCSSTSASFASSDGIQVLQQGAFLSNSINRRLILVKPKHSRFVRGFPRLIIIVFNHEGLSGWVTDARIIPLPHIHSSDVGMVDLNKWDIKHLLSLPRTQKLPSGTLILQVAPRLVRGRSITVLDIFVTTGPWDLAVERAAELIASGWRLIRYQLRRALAWTENIPEDYWNLLQAATTICICTYGLFFSGPPWTSILVLFMGRRFITPVQRFASENSLQRLEAWDNSNRGNARYIFEDFLNMWPFLCIFPAWVLWLCYVFSAGWAIATAAIITTFWLTFFAVQAYKWGNWIWRIKEQLNS
jgi:hypothetical protein